MTKEEDELALQDALAPKLSNLQVMDPSKRVPDPPEKRGDGGIPSLTLNADTHMDPRETDTMAPVDMIAESGGNTAGEESRRGAAKKRLKGILKTFMKKYKTDLVILLETRVSGTVGSNILKKLGFTNSIIEEARGFAGGIWILWNQTTFTVDLVEQSHQCIHLRINWPDKEPFIMSAVYASPNLDKRNSFWDELRDFHTRNNEAWVLAGDFNDILGPNEKRGGASMTTTDAWPSPLCWTTVTFWTWGAGPFFTWKEPKFAHLDRVYKRLDRGERPFRLFPPWLDHPNFKQVLKDNWKEELDSPSNLSLLTPVLRDCNSKTFGNILQKKYSIMQRLLGIQRSLEIKENRFLEDLEIELNLELEDTLSLEEKLWYQKSREKWIRDGDRNTTYYHTTAVIRRRRNKIGALKNDLGIWIRKEHILKEMATNFYKDLFSEDVVLRP
ncbi:uncharacterized protein LOC133289246 [Gastrolobium bilobum]|uniref:uncharacterized protein LOC133289246 n=1 Tax=Gastrolobium bilobum TaxID=150636 RepID=UPI002AB2A361|nr:uncharacterized protein LOC133289246 [Gastrolobium bilobum]